VAVAIAIFGVALAAIATERIDRTRIAMLGALLMLLTQTLDQEQAIAATSRRSCSSSRSRSCSPTRSTSTRSR
jgi:Na+/H+ antiporter NhaD/arsenite permease-like protein